MSESVRIVLDLASCGHEIATFRLRLALGMFIQIGKQVGFEGKYLVASGALAAGKARHRRGSRRRAGEGNSATSGRTAALSSMRQQSIFRFEHGFAGGTFVENGRRHV